MANLSKKHYEAIAGIIKERLDISRTLNPHNFPAQADALWNVSNELAEYFAKDNPNFRHGQFIEACGDFTSRGGGYRSARKAVREGGLKL